MKTSNIILGIIITVLVIQAGFIIYQNESIKLLDNEVVSLDTAIDSLSEELGLTKTELQDKIDKGSAQTKKDISRLTADVIKTQEDLEEQSDQLEEQLDEIKSSVSDDFSNVIEDTIDGVVTVKTDVSQGSGFIINDDGYIATNYHVIEGSNDIEVILYGDSVKSVSLIGYNSGKDIALLKILGDYDYLIFGDSDNVDVGEKVIAMGNPFGLSFSVTEGIISALDRNGPAGSESYIQTDVPLNPGNSGGPLVSKAGKVIGINNFKISDAENLGFALESNIVVETINEIAQDAIGEIIVWKL